MTLLFNITPVGSIEQVWQLKYNPQWENQFMTVSGPEHIWNWDFFNGCLLKDGEQLTGHTITVEREGV